MSDVVDLFVLNTEPHWTLFDAYLVGVLVGAVLVFAWRKVLM